MTDNIIVNKEIDVVHLHSDTDLTIETNTQIRFSTSNILINYIPFDQYIRKVVFDQSYTSVPVSEMNDNSWSESVNISDTSSLINLNTYLSFENHFVKNINLKSKIKIHQLNHYDFCKKKFFQTL